MLTDGSGIGAGSDRSAVVLRGGGRARGFQGRRAGSWGVDNMNVKHFTKLAGFLDVSTGVRDGARAHCRLALLELLGAAGDIEAATELVRWNSRAHWKEKMEMRLRNGESEVEVE